MSEIIFVVARARNGVIGKDGGLPWHLPADLQHFKRLTMGKPMIMGRKTFESFRKPLPGRRHIVLTRDREWEREGAEAVHSVEEAVEMAGKGTVAVIGGAEIFGLFDADVVELTEVHADAEGDVTMPAFDKAIWHEVSRQEHLAENGRPAFSWVRLERR